MAKSNKDKPFEVVWLTAEDLKRIDFVTDLNYRNPLLMNTSGMIDDLVRDKGIIQQPIHLVKFSDEVRTLHNVQNELVRLRGHRRLSAMLAILERPDLYTAEVVRNLQKFPAVIWENLNFQEARLFILDQNSEQGLSPSEIVKAVYDLSAMGYSEMDIADRLYNLLGKLTKAGRDKIRKAEEVKEEKERRKLIRDAVHPYLGNYLLRAEKVGPAVRDQVLYLHKAADNALQPGEVIAFTANTSAMNELSQAKTKDEKSDEGNLWKGPVCSINVVDGNVIIEGGGPETNAVITKLVNERLGVKDESEEVAKPLNAKQIKDKMDSFRSRIFKGGLRLAGGEKSEEFAKLDDEAYAIEKKLEWLGTVDFSFPEVAAAMKAFREEKNLEKVKEAFKPLLKA